MARFRENWTLASACEALHMSNNGSSDPLPSAVADDLRAWLTWRLEHWTPTPRGTDPAYDNAYRSLVAATLLEVAP